MSLRIRQRIFTLTDTYDVCDHTGMPRYSVQTEFLTIGHRIHIFEVCTGVEVGRINERVLTFLQKAELTVCGVPWLITRRLTFFRPKYDLEYKGWQIDGDFFGWNYRIVDGAGNVAAVIEHEPLHLSDTYTVSASDPDDELMAMMTAIAIDMLNCGR